MGLGQTVFTVQNSSPGLVTLSERTLGTSDIVTLRVPMWDRAAAKVATEQSRPLLSFRVDKDLFRSLLLFQDRIDRLIPNLEPDIAQQIL
jgi:hypothetical protein